jgi:hypothetical protein
MANPTDNASAVHGNFQARLLARTLVVLNLFTAAVPWELLKSTYIKGFL